MVRPSEMSSRIGDNSMTGFHSTILMSIHYDWCVVKKESITLNLSKTKCVTNIRVIWFCFEIPYLGFWYTLYNPVSRKTYTFFYLISQLPIAFIFEKFLYPVPNSPMAVHVEILSASIRCEKSFVFIHSDCVKDIFSVYQGLG